MVVIPSPKILSAKVLAALREYVKGGGNLLVAGCPAESGDSEKALILQDALGISIAGKRPGGFIPVRGRGYEMFCPVLNVRLKGARALAYFMKDEDTPAKKWPASVLHHFGKGRAAYIPFDICTEYVNYRAPFVRDFIIDVLKKLSPARLVKIEGTGNVELFLCSKGDRLLIHLINRAVGKEMEGADWFVEDIPPCGPLSLSIRCSKRPKTVTLEPGGKTLKWTWRGGMLKVVVERLHIHSAVVVFPWVKP